MEALQSGTYQFDFINSQGQQVLSFKQAVIDHSPMNIPVDISNLSVGVYTISVVNSQGEREMMRFVKM
jgi:catalase